MQLHCYRTQAKRERESIQNESNLQKGKYLERETSVRGDESRRRVWASDRGRVRLKQNKNNLQKVKHMPWLILLYGETISSPMFQKSKQRERERERERDLQFEREMKVKTRPKKPV